MPPGADTHGRKKGATEILPMNTEEGRTAGAPGLRVMGETGAERPLVMR